MSEFKGKAEKHLLVLSSSQFDPTATSANPPAARYLNSRPHPPVNVRTFSQRDVARLPQMRVTLLGAGSLGDRGGAISSRLFEVRLSFSHSNSIRTTPVFG
jgi:hypothetical protein